VWSVLVPYVVLYLVAQVSYWWPLGRLGRFARPLWFSYLILFALSTILNLASHG
jgi:hypothetical protein